MNIPGLVYVPPRSTHPRLFSKAWLWPWAFFPNQAGPRSSPPTVAVLRPGCCCWGHPHRLRSFNRHGQRRKTDHCDHTATWIGPSEVPGKGMLMQLDATSGEVATMRRTLTNGRQEMTDHLHISWLLFVSGRLFQDTIIFIWSLWRCFFKTCLWGSSGWRGPAPPYVYSSLFPASLLFFPGIPPYKKSVNI